MVPKVKCQKCGETSEKMRQFSAQPTRGDLYIAEIAHAGGNPVYRLCSSCSARTLQWDAQLGFDIHSHAFTQTCDSNCFTKQNGRLSQFASLSLADSRRRFALVKVIDGQPKVNGTPAIFSCRLNYFIGGAYARQMYYESIDDPAEVARQLILNEKLRWSGVLYTMRDCHQMVVEWFESSYNAPGGIIQIPSPGEKSIGFHAITVEGYDPEAETFNFWNSWGSGWGDRGYGKISLDFVRRYHNETFVVRHARWGPSPAKLDQMEKAQENSKEIRRLWIIENPRFGYTVRGKGRNPKVTYYYTISPTTGVPVTCIELKTGFGLRMAWLFLRHSSDAIQYSEITELYVWPLYRRMRLGTELEHAAVEEARIQGSSQIRLLMNDADHIIGPPRAAAREFAKACGYHQWWRTTVQPRARMTGTKSI
jgi:GNAT superfamily N-acetyltransferase